MVEKIKNINNEEIEKNAIKFRERRKNMRVHPPKRRIRT